MKVRESELSGLRTPDADLVTSTATEVSRCRLPDRRYNPVDPIFEESTVSGKETARLLEAWREAERASRAARLAAEHALEAAEAAGRAAEAARIAAEDAGVSVEAADRVTSGAKHAYHEHEADVVSEERRERPRILTGGLGETS